MHARWYSLVLIMLWKWTASYFSVVVTMVGVTSELANNVFGPEAKGG